MPLNDPGSLAFSGILPTLCGRMADTPAHHTALTIDDVRHVARLARLALDAAHLRTFTPQLESILEYVDKIRAVDVAGVEPMAHALPLANVLRDDVVEPSLPIEKVLQNAPATDGRFFKVPKVIGGDEDSAG
jgi:aspartyl-tRNA(Asn)/glutamyl-tRNA(Gln) amidotransferase subunit C